MVANYFLVVTKYSGLGVNRQTETDRDTQTDRHRHTDRQRQTHRQTERKLLTSFCPSSE